MKTQSTGEIRSKSTRHTRKSGSFVKYHPNKKSPIHRLPFVGNNYSIGPELSFWDLPATGGYVGGCKSGGAAALMFIKCLRDNPDYEMNQFQLGKIVHGFIIRMTIESDEYAKESLQGQLIGFMEVLSKWLSASAEQLGRNLDELKDGGLLDALNEGLAFVEKG